jgi:hypothetical protein
MARHVHGQLAGAVKLDQRDVDIKACQIQRGVALQLDGRVDNGAFKFDGVDFIFAASIVSVFQRQGTVLPLPASSS